MNNENLMTKAPNNESVTLPKNFYVLNILAMGVAIQILAKITGESIEAWKDYIGSKASEQYRQLSAEKIQQIVDTTEILQPPDEPK
ncbi:hypothetical protein [uncultured Nostoc sp.]|uniref:hypothetical protein n=1 Tax=uncultured Nostoc sp. TaxID=340711 RepID=UPI002635E91A|nr:hypothetical protein [uncultured Nostoc sp.]